MSGRVYDLQAWKRARRLHLSIEPLCRQCLSRGLTVPGEHVDHIVPISKGGDWWDGDNLQTLCQTCHSLKTRADEGKRVSLGCAVDGQPADLAHPWNAQGEGGSDGAA